MLLECDGDGSRLNLEVPWDEDGRVRVEAVHRGRVGRCLHVQQEALAYTRKVKL